MLPLPLRKVSEIRYVAQRNSCTERSRKDIVQSCEREARIVLELKMLKLPKSWDVYQGELHTQHGTSP